MLHLGMLGPRETSELIVAIKAPVNELSSTTFDAGIYVTINNGYETSKYQKVTRLTFFPGAYCTLEYDDDSRPLLGIDRNGKSTQTITIRNVGNEPLDSIITATTDAKNWDVSISDETISNLAPGQTVTKEVEVGTNDDTKAGIEELTPPAVLLKRRWRLV